MPVECGEGETETNKCSLFAMLSACLNSHVVYFSAFKQAEFDYIMTKVVIRQEVPVFF